MRKIEEEDKSGVETSSLEDVEITEDEGSEYTSQLPKSSNTKSNRYAGDVGGGPPEQPRHGDSTTSNIEGSD